MRSNFDRRGGSSQTSAQPTIARTKGGGNFWYVLGLGGALARASPPSARTSEARARRTRPRPTPYPRISSRRGAPRADPRPRARVFAPPPSPPRAPAGGFHPAPWTSGACSAGIDARSRAARGLSSVFRRSRASRDRATPAARPRARRARNPPRSFARGARSPALTQSSRPSTSFFPRSRPFPQPSQGASPLRSDGGQAEDLVLLRPRCRQLLLRPGPPDEAPSRAHDPQLAPALRHLQGDGGARDNPPFSSRPAIFLPSSGASGLPFPSSVRSFSFFHHPPRPPDPLDPAVPLFFSRFSAPLWPPRRT
jgi:hypothetical protein